MGKFTIALMEIELKVRRGEEVGFSIAHLLERIFEVVKPCHSL
jgi:hypothetical protein